MIDRMRIARNPVDREDEQREGEQKPEYDPYKLSRQKLTK